MRRGASPNLESAVVLAAAALFFVACTTQVEPDPIEPGTFRLFIDSTPTELNPGMRFQLEADGSFTGQRTEGALVCNDRLSDEALADLATTVTRARILERDGQSVGTGGRIDGLRADIVVEIVSGDRAGTRASVRYETGGEPVLDDLAGQAGDALAAASAAGRCTGCPPDAPGMCIEVEATASTLCLDGSTHVCDAAAEGRVVSCTEPVAALRCEAGTWLR